MQKNGKIGGKLPPAHSLYNKTQIIMDAKIVNKEILFKYFKGEATPDEQERILEWIAESPAHKEDFKVYHLMFDGIALYGDKSQIIAQQPKSRMIMQRVIRYSVGVAAAVMLIAGSYYASRIQYAGSLSKQYTTISVPAGQQMRMSLADGSQVQLNSGATIEYPVVFSDKSRIVKLSGEAMFNVEHDAKRPFIVETFATKIQVHGTKFNVLADKSRNYFSATLVEGAIQVTNNSNPQETLFMKPYDVVVLADGQLYKKHTDNLRDLGWAEGLIHIKKMPFDELMATFERVFDVKIIIKREKLPEINVKNGEIRISDGVEYALHVLQQISDFTYERDLTSNVIVIK